MRRFLADERGQMVVEMLVLIPAFTVALLLVVNVGLFLAEVSRFDRLTCEVARGLTAEAADPASCAATRLSESMGYSGDSKGPYTISVDVSDAGMPLAARRRLHFTLTYRLFGRAPGGGVTAFKREKTLVIPWSCGL